MTWASVIWFAHPGGTWVLALAREAENRYTLRELDRRWVAERQTWPAPWRVRLVRES